VKLWLYWSKYYPKISVKEDVFGKNM